MPASAIPTVASPLRWRLPGLADGEIGVVCERFATGHRPARPVRSDPWETYKTLSMLSPDTMTYVSPSVVLERLSEFTSGTVVEAIGEESRFVRAQVGSMSSTLGFLSREVEHRDESVRRQRRALLDALDDLGRLGDDGAGDFVADRREAVESVEPTLGNLEDVRTILRETLEELRVAVDDGTFGEDTPEARTVLYDLFETRVENQLRVLGRDAD